MEEAAELSVPTVHDESEDVDQVEKFVSFVEEAKELIGLLEVWVALSPKLLAQGALSKPYKRITEIVSFFCTLTNTFFFKRNK